MHAFWATFPVGTESAQIEFAELFSDVLLRAAGAERAESAFVVRTGREFGSGIDVEIEAFVAVWAVSVA